MIYKLRKNNKGAALMLVLVAVALVTVLVTTMLTASLINIQMKASERKGVENFYEADNYMDMVKAVIKTDADKVLDSAYKKLLINYKGTADEEENFYEGFVTEYLKAVLDMTPSQVEAAALGSSVTMDTKLAAYAGRILTYDGGTLDKGGKTIADFKDGDGNLVDADDWDGGALRNMLDISIDRIEIEKNPVSGKYNGVITFKGVKVTYTDEKDYQTTVKTDMKITADYPNPNITFDKIDPSQYIFINDGLLQSSISSSASNMVVGNVCSIEGISVNNKSTFNAKKILTSGTITANASSDLVINTESGSDTYFKTNYNMLNLSGIRIYEGKLLDNDTGNNDTTLDASAFKLNTDAVWAGNIEINGGSYTATGNTYLSDDLTFVNKKSAYPTSSATFNQETGVINNFVGFGSGKRKAENNSSIIFNTDKFYLDMSGLSRLVLSGNALIHIDRKDSSVSEITEGESISYYKLQQIYLVPTKLLGTKINSNPTLAADIDPDGFDPATYFNTTFANFAAGTTEADVKAVQEFETQYGISFATLYSMLDPTTPVKFDMVANGQAYMFLNFKDVDAARWYMQQYYSNNTAAVDKILDKLNASSKIMTLPSRQILGNYVSGSGIDVTKTSVDYASQTYSADYTTYFKQLLGSLNPKGVGGVAIGEKATIYKNLANDAKISAITTTQVTRNSTGAGDPASKIYNHYVVKYYNSADGSDAMADLNTEDYIGVPAADIADNLKVPAILIANGDVTISGSDFYGLIVASGDVKLNSGVHGLVIAKGDITYFDNKTYECDRELIYNMLHDDAIGRLVGEYLKCYQGKVLTGTGKKVYTQAVEIEYDNWQENPD